MGINAEMVKLVAGLRHAGVVSGDSVIELGAQAVCVVEDVVARILREYDLGRIAPGALTTPELYQALGFTDYHCIDATGENSAFVFDLNRDIRAEYGFVDTYNLVTNLGTAEHCFDQRNVFKNIHNLCKSGGLIIHAAPAQGNVNHAFYNYHPRFFADLAAANGYEVVSVSFTIDYRPEMIEYTIENFKKFDSHDILLYVTYRKMSDNEFVLPFDGMFSSQNNLQGYHNTGIDPLSTEFSPYLKGSSWENTKGTLLFGDKEQQSSLLSRLLRKISKV